MPHLQVVAKGQPALRRLLTVLWACSTFTHSPVQHRQTYCRTNHSGHVEGPLEPGKTVGHEPSTRQDGEILQYVPTSDIGRQHSMLRVPKRSGQWHEDPTRTMASPELSCPPPPAFRRSATASCRCIRGGSRRPPDAECGPNEYGQAYAACPHGPAAPGKTQVGKTHSGIARGGIRQPARTTRTYPGCHGPGDQATQACGADFRPSPLTSQGRNQSSCGGRRPPQAGRRSSCPCTTGLADGKRHGKPAGTRSLQSSQQHCGGRRMRVDQGSDHPREHRSRYLQHPAQRWRSSHAHCGCCKRNGLGPTATTAASTPAASARWNRCDTAPCRRLPANGAATGPRSSTPSNQSWSRRPGISPDSSGTAGTGTSRQVGIPTPCGHPFGNRQGPEPETCGTLAHGPPQAPSQVRRGGLCYYLQGRIPTLQRRLAHTGSRPHIKGGLPDPASWGPPAPRDEPARCSPGSVGGRPCWTAQAACGAPAGPAPRQKDVQFRRIFLWGGRFSADFPVDLVLVPYLLVPYLLVPYFLLQETWDPPLPWAPPPRRLPAVPVPSSTLRETSMLSHAMYLTVSVDPLTSVDSDSWTDRRPPELKHGHNSKVDHSGISAASSWAHKMPLHLLAVQLVFIMGLLDGGQSWVLLRLFLPSLSLTPFSPLIGLGLTLSRLSPFPSCVRGGRGARRGRKSRTFSLLPQGRHRPPHGTARSPRAVPMDESRRGAQTASRSPLPIHPSRGTRVGEATHPGPATQRTNSTEITPDRRSL